MAAWCYPSWRYQRAVAPFWKGICQRLLGCHELVHDKTGPWSYCGNFLSLCEPGSLYLGCFTLELEGLWSFEIQNLTFVENTKIFPLQFTLELEGLRDQGCWTGWTNPHGVPHGIEWIMSHGVVKPISKRWVYYKTERPWHFKSHYSPWWFITYSVEGPTWIGW